ncbi:hypothetical protein BSZ39_10855 [Bowdeniella nasicola]|uniref:Copper chaperone PCu(A)C n=1 Tax=Bowdeniella nasicola TaxID=208480 RepID=A0A1Q5PZZ1_9ACTO|nr:copper chaperone PCu(A)C [Bowdeniella nasicola]OKL53184.1 hypothetical protein BSZ39_10855 [Bowdeniella nasicola]
MRSARIILVPLATAALVLTGCASNSPAPTDSASTSAAASEAPADSANLTFTEMWIKATDGKMTAVFGSVKNTTDKDIHVVGVESDVAGKSELHETVSKDGKMVMQEMKDGFVIKAGESKELKPGGDHLMLMQLPKPIEPGQDVKVTLKIEGGETINFTATARSYDGANEEYDHGGEGTMGGDGHDHDGHDHEGHDHDKDNDGH